VNIFCDTNILIAGFSEDHPQHALARPVLERVKSGKDIGFVAAHSLAEAYAVLTRLPGAARIGPTMAWQLIFENVIKNFNIVTLTAREYTRALELAAERGVEGGKTYDALLLTAAAKSAVERIFTFNVGHFRLLCESPLRDRITAP
jgi:predicted nucleic acid-binding protein